MREYPVPDLDVEELPRRTAHAVHALLESSRQANMPVTAKEAMLYDEEAISPLATGLALANARKLGLAIYTGRYWTPSFDACALRPQFERRYLRETEELFGAS